MAIYIGLYLLKKGAKGNQPDSFRIFLMAFNEQLITCNYVATTPLDQQMEDSTIGKDNPYVCAFCVWCVCVCVCVCV